MLEQLPELFLGGAELGRAAVEQVPQPQVKDQPQQGYNDQHVHADLQPQGRAGGRGDRGGRDRGQHQPTGKNGGQQALHAGGKRPDQSSRTGDFLSRDNPFRRLTFPRPPPP